jgi:hypothetical protein
MSFTRYQKPTSANIVYKDSHAVLAPEQLIVLSNKYKLLYNNNGTLEWMGFNGANLPLKLDGSALISSQYLPSYVDDVQEYNSFANFPTVGETGKIYIDISGSNKVYRWSGTSYFLITDLTNYYTKAEINTTTTTLQTNITTEGSTRSSADTGLSNRITPLETLKTNSDASFTLSGTNVVLAKNIDMNTKTITNCPTLTTITTDLASEVTNRTNAISTEASSRSSADTSLSNRITPLETFKSAGDLNFNLADATNFKIIRPLDMTTNAIINCPTITTITTNVSSEIINRSNADTSLSNRINPLETFKTAGDLNFNLADATNFKIIRPLDMQTNAITNCPTITTITTNVSSEITNRTNADSSLQTQINTINTNAFMKNATGTTTIGSMIDCNGNSIINSNIMHCGSLKTGSINTEAGTYIASVITAGFDINYGKYIYLDNNRSGRESISCTITANHSDASDSLVISGKGNTPWAHDRRIYLQDIVTVRDQVNVPTLNTKTCDGLHRLTRPDIYSATASVSGSNFFEYASLASYKIYQVMWYRGTAPQFSGWSLSTDNTYTSINITCTAGDIIRCVVLMCQN